MKYRFTILNVSALIYLIGCICFTLINYARLSGGEGWGKAYMIVLFTLGLAALLVDFVIRKIFKDQKIQQIVSAIATVLIAIVIYMGS